MGTEEADPSPLDDLYSGIAHYYAAWDQMTDEEREQLGFDWAMVESRELRKLDEKLRQRP